MKYAIDVCRCGIWQNAGCKVCETPDRAQVDLAKAWLCRFPVNARCYKQSPSSYHLKRLCARELGRWFENGSMIKAAQLLCIPIRPDGLNAQIAIRIPRSYYLYVRSLPHKSVATLEMSRQCPLASPRK